MNFTLRIVSTLALLAFATQSAHAQTRLRLMAANTTSGNNQSYEGPGIRIFQALKPDIVAIQEFKYLTSSTADLRTFVDTAFGTEYTYFRESGGGIPNGIISRYPILAAGEWEDPNVSDRDFAWARIDIPGSKDLWVVSVHLLTSGATIRNTQANLLVDFVQANVPAGDYFALGGDFNTDNRSESCISTFSAIVNTAAPYPVDRNNNGNTNASRAKPYDWMLVDSDLHALRTALVVGSSSFTNGLVFDSRVYSPLSEVAPVQSGDSGATAMQHMAVVRDFLVPDGTPTPSPTPSPSPSPSVSPTASPTASPSPTGPTPTPSVSPSPSNTPTASPSPVPTAGTLIFSEYIEGSGNNKAFELWNPTGSTIDLTGWSVTIYRNGSSTPETLVSLTGTIPCNGVRKYVFSGASASLNALADVIFTTSPWSGDDALGLVSPSGLVDSIGQSGFDPGTSWSANGVATGEQTLLRKPDVRSGDTNLSDAFDPSATWLSTPQDTFTNFGTSPDPTANPCATATPSVTPSASPTASPSPSASPTSATASPSPSASASASPTASPSPSASPTSATASPSPSASASTSPTATPSPSASPTTATASPSPSASATETPTATVTATETATATVTNSPTGTTTPTATPMPNLEEMLERIIGLPPVPDDANNDGVRDASDVTSILVMISR